MYLKYVRKCEEKYLLKARESGQFALLEAIDIVAAHHINGAKSPKGRVQRAVHVYVDIAAVLGYLPKSKKK